LLEFEEVSITVQLIENGIHDLERGEQKKPQT